MATDSPNSEIVRYRIIGRAHPERSEYWFDPISITTSDKKGLLQRVAAKMNDSQFSAELEVRTADEIDWRTVKVYLQNIVRSVLDTIGLFTGAAVDCEVDQIELPSSDVLDLNSSFDGLAIHFEPHEFESMWKAAYIVRGLRLGLADFRLAVSTPHDTLFLVYRALDGIRADIADIQEIGDGSRSWEVMREITKLARDEIDEIKAKADLRRHGRDAPLSNEERLSALRLLQTALVRYRDWCLESLDQVRQFAAGEPVESLLLVPEASE